MGIIMLHLVGIDDNSKNKVLCKVSDAMVFKVHGNLNKKLEGLFDTQIS